MSLLVMINEKYIKKYCCEELSLIENYEKALNDPNETWHCHHKLETDLGLSQQELINTNRYWNVEAKYLIFLTSKEHYQLHKTGKPRSSETKHKISETEKGRIFSLNHRKKLSENNARYWKGKSSPMKGKSHSEEAKEKNRQAHLGKTAPIKGKKKVWNDESHTKFHFE